MAKDESSAYAQEERGVSPFQCHDRLGQATAKEANKEPEREREAKDLHNTRNAMSREREGGPTDIQCPTKLRQQHSSLAQPEKLGGGLSS